MAVEDIKRILTVSRSTKSCAKAIRCGASLARRFGAELVVLHVISNPFSLEGWNLPIPTLEGEYKHILKQAREDLDEIINEERENGLHITELIEDGDPTETALRIVKEERIDLLVTLAHQEGHLEHFLFGRSNEDIIRAMPCSVLLVKHEPEPIPSEPA